MLAKQLATINVLSRGRMGLLTVGLGVLLPGEAAAVLIWSYPQPLTSLDSMALGHEHAQREERANVLLRPQLPVPGSPGISASRCPPRMHLLGSSPH